MNDLPLLRILNGMAYALVLTCLIEGCVTLLMKKSAEFLLFNFWCNVITNPLLNAVCIGIFYMTGSAAAYRTAVGAGEIAVLFSEALLYKAFDKGRHGFKEYFVLSLVTNLISFLSGIFIDLFR